MSDIAERLTEYLLHGGLYNPELMQHDKVRDLLIDCRDEIARLRDAIRRLAEQDATLPVCGGIVTVTMDTTPTTHATPSEGSVQGDGTLSKPLYRHPLCQDSLQKNLTEAEHDALEFAVETGRVATHDQAILRSLLERLK
jgi:hypothetical protein